MNKTTVCVNKVKQ